MNNIFSKKPIAAACLAIITVLAAQPGMALMSSEEAVEQALSIQPGDFEEVVQVQIDGRDVWQISIIDAEGAEILVHFDVETGVLVEPAD
jgi:hypothetical protein